MRTNIPNSFQLGGITYNVILKDIRSAGEKNNLVGQINYPYCTIEIYNDCVGCIATDEYKEQSFYHELVHGLLTCVGRRDLNDDEAFVDSFATFLHQYNKTVKYE